MGLRPATAGPARHHVALTFAYGGNRLCAAGADDLPDRVRHGRSLPGALDCRMALYGDLFLRLGALGAIEWRFREET